MDLTAPAETAVDAPACSVDDRTPQPDAGSAAERTGKLWRPRRVLITPEAYELPHGRTMLERASSFGAEVVRLKNNRLMGLNEADERKAYALAKTTFAIVVSPPGQRKLQPIPPSADWQFHVAQGCPAHCQYCYLAGSLSGPPVTRAYANLPEILEGLRGYVGAGTITSRSVERMGEGTTFEASCYTDPLGIEHLTGALEEAIRFFGSWDAIDGVPRVDLTAELITHRFTPGSKEVLLGWYPKTKLDLEEANRTEKRNKFGGFKYVYPKDSMGAMKSWFYQAIGAVLPAAKILYWT